LGARLVRKEAVERLLGTKTCELIAKIILKENLKGAKAVNLVAKNIVKVVPGIVTIIFTIAPEVIDFTQNKISQEQEWPSDISEISRASWAAMQ